MKRFIRIAVVMFLVSLAIEAAAGSPTGWDSIIVPTGDYRQQIKSMPIEDRPGRPFHLYGNTVRYMHLSSDQAARHRSHSQSSQLRWTRPVSQVILGTDRLQDELR